MESIQIEPMSAVFIYLVAWLLLITVGYKSSLIKNWISLHFFNLIL